MKQEYIWSSWSEKVLDWVFISWRLRLNYFFGSSLPGQFRLKNSLCDEIHWLVDAARYKSLWDFDHNPVFIALESGPNDFGAVAAISCNASKFYHAPYAQRQSWIAFNTATNTKLDLSNFLRYHLQFDATKMLLKPARFIVAAVLLITVLTHCLIAYRYFVRSSASQDLDRIPTVLERFHQLLLKVQPGIKYPTS